MKLNRQEVTPKLIEIMNNINCQPELYVEENYDFSLTGGVLQWSEYDLIFLVMELIEEFGITFDKTDFENYRFNTINNVLDVICSKEIT